jgi:hypothetical protein
MNPSRRIRKPNLFQNLFGLKLLHLKASPNQPGFKTGLVEKKEDSNKNSICGRWRRPAAKEQGNHKDMEKPQRKIMMKIILPEHYFTERVKKQGKKDKGKELPPKLAELGPVLNQQPAVKQESFRNQKPGLF